MGRISRRHHRIAPEKCLNLVAHQVSAKAFYAKVEKDGALRLIIRRVLGLIIEAVVERGITLRRVARVVAHIHAGSQLQRTRKKRGLIADAPAPRKERHKERGIARDALKSAVHIQYKAPKALHLPRRKLIDSKSTGGLRESEPAIGHAGG